MSQQLAALFTFHCFHDLDLVWINQHRKYGRNDIIKHAHHLQQVCCKNRNKEGVEWMCEHGIFCADLSVPHVAVAFREAVANNWSGLVQYIQRRNPWPLVVHMKKMGLEDALRDCFDLRDLKEIFDTVGPAVISEMEFNAEMNHPLVKACIGGSRALVDLLLQYNFRHRFSQRERTACERSSVLLKYIDAVQARNYTLCISRGLQGLASVSAIKHLKQDVMFRTVTFDRLHLDWICRNKFARMGDAYYQMSETVQNMLHAALKFEEYCEFGH